MKKTCSNCLIKSICQMKILIYNNYAIFEKTLGLRQIEKMNKYGYDFPKLCKLFVKDDIKELSIPNLDEIELIEKE